MLVPSLHAPCSETATGIDLSVDYSPVPRQSRCSCSDQPNTLINPDDYLIRTDTVLEYPEVNPLERLKA